jgi:hypothetical protein
MTAVTQIAVLERQAVYLLASLYRADGTLIVRDDVMSVTMELYRTDDGSVLAVAEEPYSVENVVFDTLQTDGYWSADSSGYNLRLRVRSDLLNAGAGLYRAEITVEIYNDDIDDAQDPDVIVVPFEIKVKPAYSS